ncbi:MAG: hypothetical protein HXX08_07220 [Chloroflexi bacterium]|uniref:Uncharacterized protein n=1 Tax=Candidatus Chlorohelix allophototropha TaxID=3003348 RepID=A0A8T7LXG4_9CHLR|nr:hypothetical protein [Chloroflexota bacterium]WJW67523.1 hypothetical protein OZ401_000790 [Chloroflexota bacterium L227-S17]
MSNPYDPYGGNPPGNNPYPVYNNYGSYTDRDGVNEAALALQLLGGTIRLNDSIEADVMDPVFFGMNDFTANGVVKAVSDLAIADNSGDFSFLMFGTQGDFDYLVVEADTIQYARAFIAREVKNWDMLQYLLAQKEAYLADSEASIYPCDLSRWGLGDWSMFAYRAPGRLLLRDGSFGFVSARPNYPLEYLDFTLCPAGEEGPQAQHWMRLIQVGHNQALLQGDVLDISQSSQSPVRIWRQAQEPPKKKKGLFGL